MRSHPGLSEDIRGTGFCFFCGKEPDGSDEDGKPHDAHRHVARCPMNIVDKGTSFFSGPRYYLEWCNTRRKEADLIEYLKCNPKLLTVGTEVIHELAKRLKESVGISTDWVNTLHA